MAAGRGPGAPVDSQFQVMKRSGAPREQSRLYEAAG